MLWATQPNPVHIAPTCGTKENTTEQLAEKSSKSSPNRQKNCSEPIQKQTYDGAPRSDAPPSLLAWMRRCRLAFSFSPLLLLKYGQINSISLQPGLAALVPWRGGQGPPACQEPSIQ